jgi:hypothetical protein
MASIFISRASRSETILTPSLRKLLLRYREHREKPITATGLVVPMLPRFMLLLVLALLSFGISRQVGLFFAGVFTGAVLRRASLVFQALHSMPVFLQVIDWDMVDQLLEKHVSRARCVSNKYVVLSAKSCFVLRDLRVSVVILPPSRFCYLK